MKDTEALMADVTRAAHSLSDILVDHRTTEDKVKGAAQNAPFLIIAVAAHLIVAFILGMVVLRQEGAPGAGEPIVSELRTEAPDLKIEDAPELPSEIIRSATIPRVGPDVAPDPDDPVFDTSRADTYNPNATECVEFGVHEGDEDSRSTFITMSNKGKNLAGAIGLGSGSGPGEGAKKGRPGGGKTRLDRVNDQRMNPGIPFQPLLAGLEWLRKHQSADGSWDSDGFSCNCAAQGGSPCTGRGAAVFDAGVSGLALLAFLGAGYDSIHTSAYTDTVKRGLRYLKENQDAEGCFGPRGDVRHTYAHACATIAMCEAYAATKQLPWRKSAEAAVAYINACQNPYKGWRYGKQPGDNDASVTGWMLMALKAAKDAGLPVNQRTMKDGLAYIESVTDEDTGRTGYIKKGELPVRPEGLAGKWPAAESEALTAVGMCARIFCDAGDGPMMKAGAELLAKKLPVWDEAKGSIDMYYWYYGTLVMHQLGGEHWERWEKNLKPLVVDHQIQNGCAAGSWDPKDPWGEDGGRVYSTALMTMCLEVYYRYPKVFGTRPR
jgi:hypothetical protein